MRSSSIGSRLILKNVIHRCLQALKLAPNRYSRHRCQRNRLRRRELPVQDLSRHHVKLPCCNVEHVRLRFVSFRVKAENVYVRRVYRFAFIRPGRGIPEDRFANAEPDCRQLLLKPTLAVSRRFHFNLKVVEMKMTALTMTRRTATTTERSPAVAGRDCERQSVALSPN